LRGAAINFKKQITYTFTEWNIYYDFSPEASECVQSISELHIMQYEAVG